MVQSEFDPMRQVLLHGVSSAEAELLPSVSSLAASTSVEVAEERSTLLRLKVTAPTGGYLVLNDTFYPGWRAEVDNVAVPIYRANISVRAVRIPAGAQTVEFTYYPVAFYRGLAIACGAVLVLLGLFAGLQFRLRQLQPSRTP
jgi:uncharacterized membrane protein YfhO